MIWVYRVLRFGILWMPEIIWKSLTIGDYGFFPGEPNLNDKIKWIVSKIIILFERYFRFSFFVLLADERNGWNTRWVTLAMVYLGTSIDCTGSIISETEFESAPIMYTCQQLELLIYAVIYTVEWATNLWSMNFNVWEAQLIMSNILCDMDDENAPDFVQISRLP